MLSKVLSLWLQILLYVLGHLEEFSPDSLALLPTSLRKWLFFHLPVADVCILDSTSMAYGIDMNDVWKNLFKNRVLCKTPLMEKHIRSWREYYLDCIWEDVFKYVKPSLADVSISEQSQWVHSKCSKSLSHPVLQFLFSMDIATVTDELTTGKCLFEMFTVNCLSCQMIKWTIPKRYLLHFVQGNPHNFLYILSLFWMYCQYSPKYIRIDSELEIRCPSLAEQILASHPNVLCTPLHNVLDLDFIPKYKSSMHLHILKSVLKAVHNNLEIMKVNMQYNNQGSFLSNDNFPANVKELIIHGGCSLQGYVHVDQIISDYMHQLTTVSLRYVNMSDITNEGFVMCVCGLFSKVQFKMLSMFDAELSVEVLNKIVEALFTSKFEQMLDLTSMRVYDFSFSIVSLNQVSLSSKSTRNSLALKNMHKSGFGDTCYHIIESLQQVPLKRLTLTADILQMFHHLQHLPVDYLEIDMNIIQDEIGSMLKPLMSMEGVGNITTHIPLDELVNYIHLQGLSGSKVTKNMLSALRIAASAEKLKSLIFYSAKDSNILGSVNPLSLPETTFTQVFVGLFAFPNLQEIEINLTRFVNLETTHLSYILHAWIRCAGGRKVRKVSVRCMKDAANTKIILSQMAEQIEVNGDCSIIS